MYIPKATGYIIYSPLLTSFTVVESGGSPQQKYDATNQEYMPDLEVTPYVLTPQLYIEDPNGMIDEGDYSDSLVNCNWTVEGTHNGEELVSGTHYTIDTATHALTLLTNIDPDTTGRISLTAQYVDARRGEVLKFEWSTELSCVSVTNWRLYLQFDMPKRMSLVPWNNHGSFKIPVQVMNGSSAMADDQCTYKWQVLENSAWRDVEETDLWCESDTNSKVITVNQNYINRVVLLVTAKAKENAEVELTQTFLLRRFYGQYEEEIYLTEGSFMNASCERAVSKVKVTNKNGIISNPTDYFDIEIFFNDGIYADVFRHVAYGTEGIVTRSEMGADETTQKYFATSVREITANIPLCTDDDTLLMVDDDTVVVGQFPTIERGIE